MVAVLGQISCIALEQDEVFVADLGFGDSIGLVLREEGKPIAFLIGTVLGASSAP